MTYWEAADILEHGSLNYGKIQEASNRGPLYGTNSGVVFVDEFCGGTERATTE